jgi:uncharacterized protein
MIYMLLFIAAFISWLIGTAAAGGAAIIFLLILSLFLPLSVVPILVGFVGTVAGLYRTWLYRGHIYWPILKWLLPATVLGAFVGASIFSLLLGQKALEILQLILGLVLIFSGVMGLLKKSKQALDAKAWLFFPFGFMMAVVSGVIGGSPPLINALYQRFSLAPNQVVGTKSINLLTLQASKSLAYIFLIFLSARTHMSMSPHLYSLKKFVLLAIVAGIGAAIGIYLGKQLLERINEKIFKQLMNVMLLLFGIYFLCMGFKL